jgi:hypothetical protein
MASTISVVPFFYIWINMSILTRARECTLVFCNIIFWHRMLHQPIYSMYKYLLALLAEMALQNSIYFCWTEPESVPKRRWECLSTYPWLQTLFGDRSPVLQLAVLAVSQCAIITFGENKLDLLCDVSNWMYTEWDCNYHRHSNTLSNVFSKYLYTWLFLPISVQNF